MRSNQQAPERHLAWILGFVAALLTASIEVALLGMPEVGAPSRAAAERGEIGAAQR